MTTTSRASVRRLSMFAVAALGLALAGMAAAVDRLTIMVPANPGGGWDQTGRGLEAAMRHHGFAESISIENKGGAGGTIGLAQFVNSHRGDPNALLVGGAVMVGAIITNKAPVSLSDVTPIARLTGEYDVIVVPSNSKLKTMKDLAAQLKRDPGSVSWAGGSKGGIDHILVALIAQDVKVEPAKINYIPFSGGGEALAAILGGHVVAGISGYAEFEGQIQAGKLRALAISSSERIPGIDVPTLKEQGIDVEMTNWRGVFAAPDISNGQRNALVDLIARTVKSRSWQETLKQKNWMNLYMAGDDFGEYIAAEEARIGRILTSVGLTK